MDINLVVSDKFENFVFDWYYTKYFLTGGYGSGKSHAVVQKIVLKLLEEQRTAIVVRKTYTSIKLSTFSHMCRVIREMGLLEENTRAQKSNKIIYNKSPMQFIFPNGSVINFKGLDDPGSLKSLDDVSLVWIEECDQISKKTWLEMLGRIRHPFKRVHFILSCNPSTMQNWTYQTFFKQTKVEDGRRIENVILDDQLLYKYGELVKNDVYYNHSTIDDNPYLCNTSYVDQLDSYADYDMDMYRSARKGQFGAKGKIVLPQFQIAKHATPFKQKIRSIPIDKHFIGFDFGFEDSFNAVVRMAVDEQQQTLYIYDEIYKNHLTDPEFAADPKMIALKIYQKKHRELLREKIHPIKADTEPKAIKYYQNQGFYIRATKAKYHGSRLDNTKKMKRFRRIVCSPACHNVVAELETLTYATDKNDDLIYDQFNIDPHTFSAMWYGLDDYEVRDLKQIMQKNNSF